MFSVQLLFNLFLNNSLPIIAQNFLCLRLMQKFCNCSSGFFSLLVQFSGRTTKSFLDNVLRLVIKKECNWDPTYSLDTPKNISIKNFPQVVICDTCGTRCLWHGLGMVTSIHIMQKVQETARIPE